jgi:hypothetical protein
MVLSCPEGRFGYTSALMKLSRSNLALLALNVAWLAALSYFVMRRVGMSETRAKVEYVTNYVPIAKSVRTPATIITNVIATNDFRWTQLESEDYRAYIERLRSIGCPEQTIRDIVIADVDKLLAPKMQAANPRAKDVKFWQPIEQEMWEDAEQKDALRQQRAVDFEKREVIRELLGVDLVGERLRNLGQDDYYGQRLGFLPEEKRARARLTLDQFADSERVILEQQLEDGDGVAGSAEINRVRQQKEAALAQLLTPEERAQYDLWFSPAAAAVRDAVYGMNASEEEFLKLYQLRKSYGEKYGDAFAPNASAWTDYEMEVSRALGEQRYAEYVRAQDPDYREFLRVTSRFKLAPEVAAQLYSYKQPVAEERTRVGTDPTLTPQQKNAAFRAIADETQRAVKEVLGDKAFRYLMRRTGNSWVSGRSGADGVAAAPPP